MSIQQVRSITGAGMLDCQKALKESGGNVDQAVAALRKKGLVKALNKADRVTNEGVISVALGDSSYALVELNCETDFVAKNADFLAFADGLAQSLLNSSVDSFAADSDETIRGHIAKFGENIVLKRFEKGENANFVAYVHSNKKLAVIVEYSGDATKARDAAMHIAAVNPLALDESAIDQAEIEKERAIYREELKDKPANVIDRIIDGKIAKFLGESVLLKQNFVKDPSQTVEAYLGETKIASFKRVALGLD